jgi:poly(3-hydroxybutyrate) depolymerase
MRHAIVAALLAAAAAFASAKETDAAAEAKLRADAAKGVAEYAAWCAAHGAKKDGAAAAAEAESLDAQAPKLAETKSALEALTEDAADAAAAVAKQRAAAAPKIAAVYEKLAALDHEAKDAGRFEGYLFSAVAWDPSATRIGKVRKAVEDAATGGHGEEAGRLLVRLKRIDAAGAASGKYDRVETELATKDVLLLSSDAHPLVGWLSLPKGWTRGKSYPVLVDVDGAGCNFLGSLRAFCGLRAARPVIVLAPVTFSNTNDLKPETYPCYAPSLVAEWDKKAGKRHEFDGPGVDALLDVIRKRFGGEEKVFLTGFSGGGQYTYWKLFHDPAHVRGAAPACGNFGGAGIEGAPGAGADGGPPVHLFTGEKDPYREHVNAEPGIDAQTDSAEENLKKLGYTHVERTQVKGAGHDAFPALVWKFVDEVMGAK